MNYKKSFAQLDFEKLNTFKTQGFKPKVIYDIGASNGGWTNKILYLFPQAEFHLFEPLSDIESSYSAKLEETLRQNSNVKLHKYAVGKESSIAEFYRSKKTSYGSTSLKIQNSANFDVFELQKVSLDSLINAFTIPKPDLIKADIQGGEMDVLKGCEENLPDVQLLLLETWLSRGYGNETPLIHEIVNYLLPYGFYLFDIGDGFRNSTGNLISQDFFFINKTSELAKDYRF